MNAAAGVSAPATVLLGCSLNTQIQVRSAPETLAQFSAFIKEPAKAWSPAVVQISVRGRAPLSAEGARRAEFVVKEQVTGSGVIVDLDGYIVANAHVVVDARRIDVAVIDDGQSAPPRTQQALLGNDSIGIIVARINGRRARWPPRT